MRRGKDYPVSSEDNTAYASFDDEYVPPSDNDAPSENFAYERSQGTRNNDYYRRDQRRSDPGVEYRKPPHDTEAEQGVLGAMMLTSSVIQDVVDILSPEDFYRPAHQLIYEVIIDLFADNKEIDPILVAGALDRNNDLDRVGGAPYLHTLTSSVPTAANAAYYAQIVADKGVLRRLVDAGTRVVQLGFEGTEDAEIDVVIDMAQQEVFAVSQRQTTEDYSILADMLQPTLDELDEISSYGGLAQGVPTGFIDLDALTNGLHGGQMIIIAARPGVGKSTLALDFVRSCAIENNKAAVIFSLEMSKSEIVMRMLSAEASIKLSDMRGGRLDDNAWAKLADRAGQIAQAPIFVDDSANLTMMEIRSKARKLKQKYDLKMIVVDYLQLMSSGKRVESRQQEVSEFSRQLKLLAKELDVPLIAISQLNRGPESRTDKRPQLADLRESGSLEQDADIVMLLYRPDSQDKDNERAGEADIILAKHRGGPIDTIAVAHQLHYSRFQDLGRG
ncbi:replicative DNA helicase [Corynebacterium kutscheri]|uniref:replicative DNA helicase n=1 Tax=Corynebacterium kutscheri TaxID=35755 RepID=UPI001E2F418A|nr:replicative DNA helicase [Corynebacterium kutscheri]